MFRLTKKIIKENEDKIVHFGITIDNFTGINITNSNRLIRYVVKIGQANDWAIYTGWENWSELKIAFEGDKIRSKENIRKLIKCSDKIFERYRY